MKKRNDILMQPTLFQRSLEEIINETGVGINELTEWNKKRWLSFSPDVQKKYDDKEIGMIFGWKPSTVIMRRREYDLTDYEDLREKIFAKSARVETIDEIKEDRDRLIKDKNEIEELKNALKSLTKRAITSNEISVQVLIEKTELLDHRRQELIKNKFELDEIPE